MHFLNYRNIVIFMVFRQILIDQSLFSLSIILTKAKI